MSVAIRSNPFSERSSCGASSSLAMPEHPWTRPAQTVVRAAGGAWDARSAGSGAGKHTEPVPDAQWTAVAHRDRIRQWTRMATSTIRRALWEKATSLQKPPEPKPRERPSRARRRTDRETRGPDPGIACSQRDRAQNPVNTTRTCNKLRLVDWFTGEVR